MVRERDGWTASVSYTHLLALLKVQGKSVVTSGDYQRYVETVSYTHLDLYKRQESYIIPYHWRNGLDACHNNSGLDGSYPTSHFTA